DGVDRDEKPRRGEELRTPADDPAEESADDPRREDAPPGGGGGVEVTTPDRHGETEEERARRALPFHERFCGLDRHLAAERVVRVRRDERFERFFRFLEARRRHREPNVEHGGETVQDGGGAAVAEHRDRYAVIA